VKGLEPERLRELGTTVLLGNAYHLHFRPGAETVAELGGLHRFMGWDGPILTDSGGFQVFSLAKLRRLSDDGVTFRSPIDGGEHTFTPEGVLEIQAKLGSDLVMPLDVCLGYPAGDGEAGEALRITMLWAERSKARGAGADQMLFGIVQGGFAERLRREAAVRIVEMGFDGYAIGGLSVGEPRELGHALVAEVTAHLPPDRPRYVMGVGAPPDLVEAIARGADMFDCVLPTRVARTGQVWTDSGRLNLRNSALQDDPAPIDTSCSCEACRNHSRAYLAHLFRARELLAYRLASIHNVTWTLELMRRLRASLADGGFPALRDRVSAAFGRARSA
jgi:queuine tRNA-ribosyltransferase